MKTTMKKTLAILIAMIVVLGMLPVSVLATGAEESTVTETPTTLYFVPNANWRQDDVRFAVYFYGGTSNTDSWVSMTDEDGDGTYECAVPEGYTGLIFCRMNGAIATNDWSQIWNQSIDLTLPTDGTNCFTYREGDWNGGSGTWSTYTPSNEGDEPEVGDSGSTVTEVDTYDELVKAVQNGGEIKLVGDVVLAGRAGISIDTVLDLNGYTISIAEESENNSDLFLVIGGSTLTVKDTSEAGTGTIDATNATDSAIWASAGSVVLNSGYIKQGNTECGLYTAVSLTLNGGKVDRVSYNSGTITIGADMALDGTAFDGIDPATSENVTGFDTDKYQTATNSEGDLVVSLKSDSGETEEPTEPEGGIPTDAVEITESDIEGQPEMIVGVLGTYDAESGWVPFEASSADTVQYNYFITDLNAGDVIYLDFSAPTDYAFGNIEGIPTQGTADGIVEITADVSGAYAAIAFSNVTLRAYVVSSPEGGDSGSDEGGDSGSTDGEVGTYDELADALEVGGNIKLTGNIELTTGLDVMADTTLDLNGYTISVAEGASVTDVLYLNDGVTLTVEDSSTDGTGVTDGTGMIDGTGASDSAIWASAGSVILNGGYIKQGDSGYGLYTCVSLTLNGGRIDRVCHSAGTITIGVDMALEGTVFEGINPATTENVTGFDTDKYQTTDNTDGTYTVTLKSESGDTEEPTTITVYFQNNWLWTEVYLYYGTPDGDSPAWRGEAMTWYDNDGNYDIYSYELPADASYFVISGLKDDGSGNTDQTPDISTEGIYDGICYYMMWDNGNTVGSEAIDVILPPVVDPEPEPDPEPETVVAWVDTDGDGVIDEGETTYTDLISALDAGGEIKLAADVADFTYVHNTGDLTLDLNGYTVTLNGWLDVCDGAYLIIKDSSTPSTGRIVCDEAINCYLDVYSDGRLLLESGTVDVIRLNGEHSNVSLDAGTVGKMIVQAGWLALADGATVTEWDIRGGKFFFDPTEYLADGYVATFDEERGGYVVTEVPTEPEPEPEPETVVAWVDTDGDGAIDEGETTYTGLTSALSAGGEIKLAADVVDFSYVHGTGELTLDLNGYTVTLNGWLDVYNGASLIIKDSSTPSTGRIVCTEAINCYLDVYSDGRLLLKSGTVDVIRLNGAYSDVSLEGGTVGKMIVSFGLLMLGEDATVTAWAIDGGNFFFDPSDYLADGYVATFDEEQGLYVVTLGSLNPEPDPEPTATKIYLYSESWTSAYVYYWSDENPSLTTWPGSEMIPLGGGYWSYVLPVEATYMVFNNGSSQTGDLTVPTDGKTLYDYKEGVWSVYVVEVDTYDELVEAVANGGEIKLVGDIALTEGIRVSTDTVLDLNGYTISVAEEVGIVDMFTVSNGCTLTVKDTSEEATGTIDATGASDDGIYVANGVLVLEGGHLKLGDSLYGLYVGSDVILNGGLVDYAYVNNGTVTLGDGATVTEWQVAGGTFSFDPTGYLDEGYVATLDEETGYYVVTEGSSESDPGFELRSASVALGSDISIIFKMFIPSERLSSAGLSITMNGKQTLLYAQEAEALGEDVYAFTFTGIAPQQMGDTLTVEVITLDGNNVTGVWDTREYSVKQNAMNLMTAYADNEALMTLLGDLLTYGAAAQVYKSYRTDALVTDGLTLSTSTATPSEDDAMVITGNESTDAYFSAAGLWFDNVNNLYVKIRVAEDVDTSLIWVDINKLGAPYALSEMEDLGDGVYKLTSEAIFATGFSTEYVYDLTYDYEVIATLTYSVNAYAYGILQSETESEEMKALALALYRYGASATAYVSGAEVTTVTEAEITLEQTEYIYSDSYIEPAVTSVVVNGVTLSEGNDYTVSYSDNYYVGTATVTVTFCGSYAGTVTTTFEIIQDPATEDFSGEWVSIGG